MNDLLNQIDEIHALINDCCQTKSWDVLQQLMRQRQDLIQNYFEPRAPNITPELVESLLAKVQQADEITSKLIACERKSSVTTSLDLQKSYSALKAYQDSSV